MNTLFGNPIAYDFSAAVNHDWLCTLFPQIDNIRDGAVTFTQSATADFYHDRLA
jgi:hypothetical protein